jgi:predicted nucleic acid-binding protein
MRAVDTNVLVRLITGDSPSQQASAQAFLAGGAWVSHVVLAETSWVLAKAYDMTPADLLDTLAMLLDHAEVTVEDPELVARAVDEFRTHPGLGFSDCLILELARSAGHTPLGTFDRDLAKLTGAERIR